MDRKISGLLAQDAGRSLVINGFFAEYPVEDYFIEGRSAILFGMSDHLWAHIFSDSEKELAALLDKHHGLTKYYFSAEDWMIPLILKFGEADWIMSTRRFILDDNIAVTRTDNETGPVEKSRIPYIYANSEYKDFISPEYIEDRLDRDISAGILVDGKLAAWGFTHDDGALGFLHVMPAFRKQGLGRDVLLGLIRMRRKAKRPVFVNIVPGNVAAISLVTKLEFKLDREASWLKLK